MQDHARTAFDRIDDYPRAMRLDGCPESAPRSGSCAIGSNCVEMSAKHPPDTQATALGKVAVRFLRHKKA